MHAVSMAFHIFFVPTPTKTFHQEPSQKFPVPRLLWESESIDMLAEANENRDTEILAGTHSRLRLFTEKSAGNRVEVCHLD
jgi:hypothetical protein